MKTNHKLLIAGILATCSMLPLTAYADKGVMLDSYEVKDQNGEIVHTYQKGDRLEWHVNDKGERSIYLDHGFYNLHTSSFLQTHNEKESGLMVKLENTVLQLNPSFFSFPIQQLQVGESLKRIDTETNEDKHWIQVETNEGLIGFVYIDNVEIKTEKAVHTTTAYMTSPYNAEGVLLDYGDQVSLIDYDQNSYLVKVGDKTVKVPVSDISLQKPTKPFVLSSLESYPDQLKIYGDIPYIMPVHDKYPRITSRFGARWGKLHAGTDVGIPIGTPIYAVASGTVTMSVGNQTSSNVGWGNYVKLNHGNEDTLYGHLNSTVVHQGEKVRQGQLIGYSGNSGHSTGPHLHLELYQNGHQVDSYNLAYQPELYR